MPTLWVARSTLEANNAKALFHRPLFFKATQLCNWQWCASTGCDPQPYFRAFNPWLQQAKFDPDCVYIKRWLPELAQLNPTQIHQGVAIKDYPNPMVNHTQESARAKKLFKLSLTKGRR